MQQRAGARELPEAAAPGRLRCCWSSIGRLHRPLRKVGWQLGAQAQLLQQVLSLCAATLHQCWALFRPGGSPSAMPCLLDVAEGPG